MIKHQKPMIVILAGLFLVLTSSCNKKSLYDYRPAFSPASNDSLSPPLHFLWKTKLASAISIQPQIKDHFLIVPNGYKQLLFMDPFQGKEILKLKLDGTVCLPILIHDDLAIIGMSKTLKNNLMIYQLRQNKVIYKGKIRKEISALFVQDSFLFVQDNKNYIHTLLLPKPILSKGVQLPGRLISPPILVKGVTYLLTENGFILIWDKLRKQVVKQMELKRFFRHPMLFHQGNLWMCDIQGWIGIIDPESLCTIHQDSLPSPSAITPFQYGDRIMMVLEDQSVMAYTDQPILVSRQFQDKISSIQHTGLSTWLISTLDGKIQLWDKELQSILWETHAVRMIKTAPLIYGNHLYFFTSDRNAFCFISP